MGKLTVSVESGNSDSDNESADVESEETSEEEEASEEPVEEDPGDDEAQEDLSEDEEGPVEEPDEEEQSEDEEGPVEEPDEEEQSEDAEEEPSESADVESEEVSEEEEPSKEPVEEDPGGDEAQEDLGEDEEGPVEEPDEEEQSEDAEEEPSESADVESEEVSEEEEPSKEPVEEDPGDDEAQEDLGEDEEGLVEEPDEEDQSEDAEEEPSGDEPSGGSPINQSYRRSDNDDSSQPNSGKMNMPSDISGSKRISEPSGIQNPATNKIVVEKLVTVGNTDRKRRSRWDIKDEANELTEFSGGTAANMGETRGSIGSEKRERRKKTRWSRWSNDNPQISTASPLENPTVEIEQQISNLQAQLLQITNELHHGVVDHRPESERSPSPPPVYNNLGMKINTREARLRAKLVTQRQAIISELICKNPGFKPPPDYSNARQRKKIFIPTKEYPGYNFIGLIVGPRGNTLKRMERETGAKILLRGKGSGHEGRLWKGKPDLSVDEDLHVIIDADNRYSLDTAVAMVEKLLVPVEDERNTHKLAQLRELAELHRTSSGANTGNSRKHEPCNTCGDVAHPTSACPLTAPAPGASSAGHRVNFFAEMGGGLSSFSGPPRSVPTTPPVAAAPVSKPKEEMDDANLFVGHLPQSVTETKLMELFFPFGPICQSKVIRDGMTGLSKGYGFVKYTDPVNAAKAVSQMNGYTIDGNTLVVRTAGVLPPPGNQPPTYPGPPANQHPTYPGTPTHAEPPTYPWLPTYPTPPANQPPTHPGTPANQHSTYPGRPTYPRLPAFPLDMNPDPMHWPGPPESRLPETVAPFSNRSTLPVLSGTFSGQFSASPAPSFQTPTATSIFSGDFAGSDELAHFPGYLKSLDPPPQLYHKSTPSSSLPPQVNSPRNFGGYHMPPT